jgi:hypothetical protein
MRTAACLVLGALAVLAVSLARATDPSSDPSGLWKPLNGAMYKLHSGIVADRTPSTASDRRLTIIVDGKTAQEIFDSIGPDLHGTCDDVKGDRARHKKGISCTYTAKDKKDKDGPYRCWIGLNLRNGNTIGTISC